MRVVNVRGLKPNSPGITYVGRTCAGWTGSPLGNPFFLVRQNDTADRRRCIELYQEWLQRHIKAKDPDVMRALAALTPESILGCWCAPLACHADVIIEEWRRLYQPSTTQETVT